MLENYLIFLKKLYILEKLWLDLMELKIILSVLVLSSFMISINDAYAADGDVTSTVEINSSTTNGPSLANSDNFGGSVANIGDLDGDGDNDIAVCALGGWWWS